MCTFSIISTITNKGAGYDGREHTYIKLRARCMDNRKKHSRKTLYFTIGTCAPVGNTIAKNFTS